MGLRPSPTGFTQSQRVRAILQVQPPQEGGGVKGPRLRWKVIHHLRHLAVEIRRVLPPSGSCLSSHPTSTRTQDSCRTTGKTTNQTQQFLVRVDILNTVVGYKFNHLATKLTPFRAFLRLAGRTSPSKVEILCKVQLITCFGIF